MFLFLLFCIFALSRNLVPVQTVVGRLASRPPNVACTPLLCVKINDHDATQCILINCHDNPTIMPLRQIPLSFGTDTNWGEKWSIVKLLVISYSDARTQSVPWYFSFNSFYFPWILSELQPKIPNLCVFPIMQLSISRVAKKSEKWSGLVQLRVRNVEEAPQSRGGDLPWISC